MAKAKLKTRVAIFGAGGHGKVVLDILLESGVEVAGFLDDDPKKKGARVLGFPVLGGLDALKGEKGVAVALGVGSNAAREEIYGKAKRLGVEVVGAVHPKAAVSRFTKLGKGAVIMAGAAVNPGCELGDGVVVNTGATVDHDCRLGRFCQIWPGAHLAGSVSVGELAYVGTGAAVVPGIAIGASAIIGAGAAVVSDIPAGVTAVGVPARPRP